jgi:hypothetical protein
MIRYTIIFFLLTTDVSLKAQNVGIGTRTPHSSAILDIADTSRGLLIPRMTAAQRQAIVNPVQGLMVYQTDGSSGYYFFTGGQWQSLLKDDKEYLRMRNLYYISNL